MLARRRLLEAGHEEAPEEEAELHVINTCCITGEAEAKSRRSVRRSLKTAREVYVGGCAVNLRSEQFAEIDAAVRPFAGTAEDVAQAMAGALGGCVDLKHEPLVGRAQRRSAMSLAQHPVGGRTQQHPPEGRVRRPEGRSASARTRGFVKVQDGCDCHCAYCIIPTVRGGARSRAASAVLGEVAARVAQGQPEVVMTGISVGDYRDPERGSGAGRADGAGRAGGGRRAGAALLRGGDPRAGLACGGAAGGAEGVPAPARADAVGRRRGARSDGAPLHGGGVPGGDRDAAGSGAAR